MEAQFFATIERLDLEWRLEAQCQGTSQEIFFYDPHTIAGKQMESIAKSICAKCPVRVECLDYAIVTNQPDGIWGGKSLSERKRIRNRAS